MTDPREAATTWYKRIYDATVKKLNENVRPGTRRDLSEENKVLLAQTCLALGDFDARIASTAGQVAEIKRQLTRSDSE